MLLDKSIKKWMTTLFKTRDKEREREREREKEREDLSSRVRQNYD